MKARFAGKRVVSLTAGSESSIGELFLK